MVESSKAVGVIGVVTGLVGCGVAVFTLVYTNAADFGSLKTRVKTLETQHSDSSIKRQHGLNVFVTKDHPHDSSNIKSLDKRLDKMESAHAGFAAKRHPHTISIVEISGLQERLTKLIDEQQRQGGQILGVGTITAEPDSNGNAWTERVMLEGFDSQRHRVFLTPRFTQIKGKSVSSPAYSWQPHRGGFRIYVHEQNDLRDDIVMDWLVVEKRR